MERGGGILYFGKGFLFPHEKFVWIFPRKGRLCCAICRIDFCSVPRRERTGGRVEGYGGRVLQFTPRASLSTKEPFSCVWPSLSAQHIRHTGSGLPFLYSTSVILGSPFCFCTALPSYWVLPSVSVQHFRHTGLCLLFLYSTSVTLGSAFCFCTALPSYWALPSVSAQYFRYTGLWPSVSVQNFRHY